MNRKITCRYYRFILLIGIFLGTFFPVFGQSDLNVDSLETALKKQPIDSAYVNMTIDLANYYTRKNLDQSMSYAKLLARASKKINHQRGLCRAYIFMGNAYLNYGQLDTSRVFFDKALVIATKQNYDNEKTVLYGVFGHLAKSKNESDKALAFYLKAVKVCEKSKDIEVRKTIPVHLNNVAILLRTEKKYKEALTYAERGYDISRKYKNTLFESVLRSTMGGVYKDLLQTEKALQCFEEAYQLKEQLHDELGMTSLLLNIAMLNTELGNYTLAEKYCQQGSELATKLNSKVALVDFKYQEAYSNFHQKKYAIAIQKATESLAMAKAVQKEDEVMVTYDLLTKCYKETGQFKEAFKYQELYRVMQDTIIQQEQNKHIEELEMVYKVEKQKKENELLKLEQTKNKTIIKQRNYLIFGAVLTILLLSGLMFLLSKAYKTKALYSETLQTQNEKLNELDTLKTNFFANISHEFKTPLTLIISPLKQLLGRQKDAKGDNFLIESAYKNSLQLLELVNQFLDLTKGDLKEEPMSNTTFDIAQLFNATCSSFESLAANQNINYAYRYEGKTPLFVISDDFKIKVIIKNLISNAIKYTAANGRIQVTGLETLNEFKIMVQDNGSGISEEDMPHLFERFYQSKDKKKLVEGGTGIGLTICKEYSEMLGGTIEVESEAGKGSRFVVTIPKNMAVDEGTETVTPIAMNGYFDEQKIFNKNLPSVLIVEDNMDMQAYLKHSLNPYYNLLIAPHGKAALEVLKEENGNVDIIISDYMMPVMNGLELITQLKATPKLANIPTIMLTAVNDIENRLSALRIGVDDYLAKPFEVEELLLRMEYLLQFKEERNNFNDTAEQTKEALPTIPEEDRIWLETLEQKCLERLSDTSLTVNALADEMLLSYTHFWRKSQALIGMTPSQYLQEIRFREARKLIEKQRYSTVKQVAYAVGFKDERNFARNFKKRFGKNPSEY